MAAGGSPLQIRKRHGDQLFQYPRKGGAPVRRWHILGLWCLVILASALASLAGYGLFGNASPNTIAFVLAFAGGAILTMLAETMIPEAYLRGGKAVGLVTTLGFGVAFAVSALD